MSFTLELLRQRAEITIEAEPETTYWADHLDFDSEEEQEKFEWDVGLNMWQWCEIRVKARYAGLVASDFLGCCSYKDEDDFKACCGYYEDMVQEALRCLEENLKKSMFIFTVKE